jgi:hypothetical protein
MEKANFILLEDKVSVYQTADTASEEIAQLSNGDEIIQDEKLIKNQITWYSVVLPDDRKGFIRADSKGIEIALVILEQHSADVFEAPDTSSKVILTYHLGDKFQIIGGVPLGGTGPVQVVSGEKYGNLMWVKTESLSGVIGFIQAGAGIKVKDVTPIPPSLKWPLRMGYIGALAGVAIELYIYYSYYDSGAYDYNSRVIEKFIILIAFFGGFVIGFLLTKFFIRVKRSRS